MENDTLYIKDYDLTMLMVKVQFFNVTVKDKDGNPLVDKVVKFQKQEESRVYEAITGVDGIAKITINRNPGEYIMISTLENGEQTTGTITVKKIKQYINVGKQFLYPFL